MKEKLVFDIEANGLLKESTEIWCLCAKILENPNLKIQFVKSELCYEVIESLFHNKIIIGHNIIDYDIPMLKKFYGIDIIKLVGKENIIDTYLWSQALNPDRELPKGCPTSIFNPITKRSKLIGPHGLESWGYRCGNKKIEIHDWTVFDKTMIDRCHTDVKINEDTYYLLCKEAGIV